MSLDIGEAVKIMAVIGGIALALREGIPYLIRRYKAKRPYIATVYARWGTQEFGLARRERRLWMKRFTSRTLAEQAAIHRVRWENEVGWKRRDPECVIDWNVFGPLPGEEDE